MDLGVIEGFFGPAWPMSARLSYASFLSQVGGKYYIYAPKQDPYLRKKWREDWPAEFISKLKMMIDHFHSHQIEFGVALSPFGLGEQLSVADSLLLLSKIKILSELGIDRLGIFFDDMPVHANLAGVQAQVMEMIDTVFSKQIIFCPSYYCFDPILEKVFGKMPDHYLEDVADKIPAHMAMAWTGPKVISPVIDTEHLVLVNQLLKRKPFIWENLFANDGPRNCKFLKLKPFAGREGNLQGLVESWGFNMMNQPELSKIVFLGSRKVLLDQMDPQLAFDQAIKEICSPEMAQFLSQYQTIFLEEGLDKMSEELKAELVGKLMTMPEAASQEVLDWLEGKYGVGAECLTD